MFKKIIPFFGFLLIWTACGEMLKNTLTVSSRNFDQQIELQQNLVFTFNKPLVSDSLTDTWTETAYIKFEPEIKGKFKWTAPNILVFSPLSGFRPDTDYRAELTEQILRASAESLALPEDRKFEFHTPYTALNSGNAFWAATSAGPRLRLKLNFNSPVDPQKISEKIEVVIGGKKQTFRAAAGDLSENVTLLLDNTEGSGTEKISVSLLKKPTKTGEENTQKITTEIPDRNYFAVLRAEAAYDNNEALIRVVTNQQVGQTEAEILRLIQFSGDENLRAEKTDDGFLLRGNFERHTDYTLKISKQLKGVFGASLEAESVHYPVFNDSEPAIAFASKNSAYLGASGAKNIGLRLTNVPELDLQVFKVYENNITHFFRSTYSEYDESYYLYNIEHFGELVYEKKIRTADLERSGETALLNLNIPDQTPFRGFYMVKVASHESQWVNAVNMVSLSDIGFIVKKSADKILVFTNSVLTAEAMSGVKVNLISENNQEVATAMSDAQGVAVFENFRKNSPIVLVTGTKGKDFNVLPFSQNEINVHDAETGGISEVSPEDLQAFIYGDRKLYRPGEKINVKVVVRDLRQNKSAGLPVKVKLSMPDGNDLFTNLLNLNDQSTGETSFDLPASAVTGSYQVQVYTAADNFLNNYTVNVEEFVPHRIRVEAKTDAEVRAGDDLTVRGLAVNLFGPPAAGRNYEMNMAIRSFGFNSPEFPDYNFALQGTDDTYFENTVREGNKTDDAGRFSEVFRISQNFRNMGILRGEIYTTVFDETGRPVRQLQSFDILTQPMLLGIKRIDTYNNVGQTINLPVVAVDTKGRPAASAEARMQMIRYDWNNVLERDYNGTYRYVSRKSEVVLQDKNVRLSGRNTVLPFIPKTSGEYELRMYLPGAKSYVRFPFYAYGEGASFSSFEADKDGEILIETNKTNYKPGETAKILFKAPFSGRLLLTVERNKVFEYYFADLKNKAGSIEIPIKDDYLPNIYLGATLIKPADNSAVPLTVAHGYSRIGVENPEKHRYEVSVSAPDKTRSGHKQKITIDVGRKEAGVEVTLAAVDEGILQIRPQPNPAPYEFFFQKRALGVQSFDLYPRLFPEIKSLRQNYGADFYDLGKRLNPLANKRIKPLAFWSGTLKTDAAGRATAEIDLPQFSGDVRLVAVAVKNAIYGTGVANMKVADPLVISTAAPLFTSPSDSLVLSAVLTNTTDKAMTVKAKILTGPEKLLILDGNPVQNIVIPANSEKRIDFRMAAADRLGTTTLTVEADNGSEVFRQITDMGVRPSVPLIRRAEDQTATSGQKMEFDFRSGFMPGTVGAKLLVGKSPVIRFAGKIDYLLQYPYGCAEQTISAAFPQLYFAEIGRMNKNETGKEQKAAFHIREALKKIKSLQSYNGGLSYWSGGDYVNSWASIYAAHFMIEARKAGYQIDENLLDQLLEFTLQVGTTKNVRSQMYYDAQGRRQVRPEAQQEVFYAFYVAALGGRKDIAMMNYYKSNPQLIGSEGKYLLASAYLLTGNKEAYKQLLPPAFPEQKYDKELTGSFRSPMRDRALALNALIEADPENAQIPIIARNLAALSANSEGNTQETAFLLLSLGKLAKKAEQIDTNAEIWAEGKKIADFTGENILLDKEVAGKKVEIRVTKGKLYVFGQSEGLSADGKFKEEDVRLKVRREFYDRFGKKLFGTNFKQNDLIYVKISLQAEQISGRVPNVAITEMLPAGLEIENPRLGAVPQLPAFKEASRADHFDFRDDRLLIFTEADARPKVFWYAVRAVSKGSFRLGPVSADAMYDAAYRSYSGGGIVRVD